MNKTIYPIELKSDLRDQYPELIKESGKICHFHFDKWNNILLVEVLENE